MTDDYDAEDQKRQDILAFGHIVAAERAEYARAWAWKEFYSLARTHMDDLHPAAATGVSDALQKAKHDAEEAHLEAEAALRTVPFHFRPVNPGRPFRFFLGDPEGESPEPADR